MENVFNILEERGYIEQMTHPKEMKELFSKESVSFYIGIDPTADSLHVGHFVSLMVASHMQKCGHKPIILVGGGTASIGDPSGKTDMRKMLSREDIYHNVECLKKQIEIFVSFDGENAAINIQKERENGEFISKEELRKRTKISKTVIETLTNHGSLDNMSDENQLSLF